MKVAILAGGLGSRLSEETRDRPKALVEIGGTPILWHILRHYRRYGFLEFVIALGYRGGDIEQFALESCRADRGLSVRLRNGHLHRGSADGSEWSLELVETGAETATGGRIRRLGPHLGDGTFCLTWCDGLSDVDLRELVSFHRSHGRLATVTAVHPPPSRFGRLELEGDRVIEFSEKPPLEDWWINGAFFVLEPEVLERIEGDSTQWEHEPLESLARDGELMAYRHPSFWQCMDTLRDREVLEELWRSGEAPWSVAPRR